MTQSLADLIEARFGLATETGAEMPAEGALTVLLGHRTHRRYRPDPVPDEMLDLLLACALSAPAKSDLQQFAIIRVEDPATRKAIADLIPAMPWIGTAPRFLVFCGDSRRIRRVCDLRGKPFANDHFDALFNAAVDAALALQNFITAADAAGLGCCPISVIRNHAETVSGLLGLPDHVFPVAGVTLGYPAADGYVSLRLPAAVKVHVDRYDDATLAAEIDGYDHRRDARYSIPPEKQRDHALYGAAEFYGWSEDKARQVSHCERDDFGRFLKQKGFKLE